MLKQLILGQGSSVCNNPMTKEPKLEVGTLAYAFTCAVTNFRVRQSSGQGTQIRKGALAYAFNRAVTSFRLKFPCATIR
jgi:hypothetical protein